MHWEKDKKEPTSRPSEMFWWRRYYRAPAADIEMTAYALLTYVLRADEDPSLIGQAMPIVRWLTKQRNALGGFASTQVGTHTGNPSNCANNEKEHFLDTIVKSANLYSV